MFLRTRYGHQPVSFDNGDLIGVSSDRVWSWRLRSYVLIGRVFFFFFCPPRYKQDLVVWFLTKSYLVAAVASLHCNLVQLRSLRSVETLVGSFKSWSTFDIRSIYYLTLCCIWRVTIIVNPLVNHGLTVGTYHWIEGIMHSLICFMLCIVMSDSFINWKASSCSYKNAFFFFFFVTAFYSET